MKQTKAALIPHLTRSIVLKVPLCQQKITRTELQTCKSYPPLPCHAPADARVDCVAVVASLMVFDCILSTSLISLITKVTWAAIEEKLV